jgi:hypothetical protein
MQHFSFGHGTIRNSEGDENRRNRIEVAFSEGRSGDAHLFRRSNVAQYNFSGGFGGQISISIVTVIRQT